MRTRAGNGWTNTFQVSCNCKLLCIQNLKQIGIFDSIICTGQFKDAHKTGHEVVTRLSKAQVRTHGE
jgi:hypothetical protein